MRVISFLACLALTGAFLAPSRAALADQASSSKPPAEAPPAAAAPGPASAPGAGNVWYGWELLVTDASLGAAAGLAFAVSPRAGAFAGGAAGVGVAVDGPIIHLVHRRYLAAGLSLGMRLLFPVVGAALGAATARCSPPPNDYYPPDPCWAGYSGAAVGFVSGAVIAWITDVAALSWETAPAPDRAAAPTPKASHLRLVPQLATVKDESHRYVVSVGVVGAF
jgi:hypothetical protein